MGHAENFGDSACAGSLAAEHSDTILNLEALEVKLRKKRRGRGSCSVAELGCKAVTNEIGSQKQKPRKANQQDCPECGNVAKFRNFGNDESRVKD